MQLVCVCDEVVSWRAVVNCVLQHTCCAAEELLVAACSLVRHAVRGAAAFVLSQAAAIAVGCRSV